VRIYDRFSLRLMLCGERGLGRFWRSKGHSFYIIAELRSWTVRVEFCRIKGMMLPLGSGILSRLDSLLNALTRCQVRLGPSLIRIQHSGLFAVSVYIYASKADDSAGLVMRGG